MFHLRLLIRLNEAINVTLPKPVYSIFNFADIHPPYAGIRGVGGRS